MGITLARISFYNGIKTKQKNANVDHLSRLNKDYGYEGIDDSFPNAHKIYMDVIPKEYA